MQIVIPMSGFGERFRRAGYTVPKPLIDIDGKPLIAHVLGMFPGEHDVIFICNQRHLDEPAFRMRSILRDVCSTARVIGIPPHERGPVHAVLQAEHAIDAAGPVVVNYCDFSCYWNWCHFKEFVRDTNCVGAIPAYKGFHPHSLGSTNYAYLREADGWVRDIQEKRPYTRNPMEEFASSGTYYFVSGAVMGAAFRAATAQNLTVGGECYVSLAYKPLLAAGKSVAVYPLQHFMQWGTPEDVAEYRGWSRAFRRLVAEPDAGREPEPREPKGSLIVSMAGLGRRFATQGYRAAKPLIPVSGKPMVIQAVEALPPAKHHVFVLRAGMPGARAVADELGRLYPTAIVIRLSHVTEGQACTALLGLDALEEALGGAPGPITFGACDHGPLYNATEFRRLADDGDTDVIVWGIRNHADAGRRPHMFSWVEADKADNSGIRRVSVKAPLESPDSDPIVAGTFTFSRPDDFRRSVERLIARNGRINGEFYIDSCVNDAVELGLHCRLFDLDHYMSWGTPSDLRTFEYWQSCFHKWPGHPYRLENDGRIPAGAVADLVDTYHATTPDLPKDRLGHELRAPAGRHRT